jgi:hypothetical protein
MNKKILLAIPMSILAAACVPLTPADDGECMDVTTPDVCTGSASNPVLGITLTRNKIVVAPPNVCAKAGTTIKVSVHPRQKETGTVATIPKFPANTWLVRSNDPDPNSFTIVVPNDLDPNTDHDYTIERSNGQCLDPRIHIDP